MHAWPVIGRLERMGAELCLARTSPGIRSRHKLGLDPDALARDALGVRLRFPDQRRQALLQIGSGCLVEAVIDLTRIDQVLAFRRPT
jgi:hypothetical protein